jgi:hypothetical protein
MSVDQLSLASVGKYASPRSSTKLSRHHKFLEVQNTVPYVALQNVAHSIKAVGTWALCKKKNNASDTVYSEYICPTTDYVVGSRVKKTTGVGFQLNHKSYSPVPCISVSTKGSLTILERIAFSLPPLIQEESLNSLHLVQRSLVYHCLGQDVDNQAL